MLSTLKKNSKRLILSAIAAVILTVGASSAYAGLRYVGTSNGYIVYESTGSSAGNFYVIYDIITDMYAFI